jgi:hypothetical protein
MRAREDGGETNPPASAISTVAALSASSSAARRWMPRTGLDASGCTTLLVGRDLHRDDHVRSACVVVVLRGVEEVDAERACQ